MKSFGLLAIAATAAFLAGCGQGKFSTDTPQVSNILTYALPQKPTEFDPAMVQDGDTIDLVQNIFEGLTMWSEDNKVVGNLATNWDVTDGGRTYVFHLKQGVKFHNGREMVADDVAFSINRAVDPKLASATVGNYLNDIVGFADVVAGKAETMSGIKVIDPYTISITIDKARPYFLGKLTYPASFVVAKEAVKPGEKMTTVGQMVGTGPFRAESYQDGQVFHVKAFKDYHEGAPQIDGIDRPVMEDSQSRYNAYKRGELDILALQRQDVPDAKNDPNLGKQLVFYPRPSIYYLGMNASVVPQFKDLRVRQAIAMALDRDQIVSEILGGQNTRADSILPPGVLGHRAEAAIYPHDVKKAQQLLAEAGFPQGKGFPPIKIYFRAGQTDVLLVAENIGQQLHETLGLTIQPSMMEWGAYLDLYNSKKNPFFHMRWAADYLDPQNFISLFFTVDGGENKIAYHNPQVDALCKQADADLNEEERLNLYAKAEDIILQDAPWVPIYFQRDAELISPRVQGLRNSLFGHLPHTKLSLKK